MKAIGFPVAFFWFIRQFSEATERAANGRTTVLFGLHCLGLRNGSTDRFFFGPASHAGRLRIFRYDLKDSSDYGGNCPASFP